MGPLSKETEEKWQSRWEKAGLHISERDERPKFMIIFAYPGVTGYLHVGHMRGYTYVDAIARFKRMEGYNVLFPVGTHATGNGPISLANRVKARDLDTIDYLFRNGCPSEELDRLETPEGVVDFFNEVYVNEYWKRFGFLSDWRRFTCSIFPDYSRFIEWQFHKLMDKGLLIQKPYYAPACIECGPVAVDPSETDLSKGGNAEVYEYTLLKFKCGEEYLVAATLRPETVYGQTNFWVNPELDYVRVRVGDETWVVSEPAFHKLRFQMDNVEMIETVPGRELLGNICKAPMIEREIPVLPAVFCDPNVGTGLVTSVPSDAPDDLVALRALQQNPDTMRAYGLDPSLANIEVISIIDIEGYGPCPAMDIVDRMDITNVGDPRLLEAKKQVYKDGHHKGVMNTNCGEYAGMRVEEAKELMRSHMLERGEAVLFYDLSEEVVCRCGKPVIIKKVDDQWFINYADPDLTARTKEHCRTMEIFPLEYYNNIPNVLDWFRERACVRQGNWMGTRFPFDNNWIIEAISDSTLYPVYYLISLYANNGSLRPEQMTESFFDQVILGEGDPSAVAKETGIPLDLIEKIRADVSYWYPLDLNLGGKEHMTVHFPAFLFNHQAIMPEDKLPRGIFVNWYVTGKKGKISKSKGGAQPIPGAAERFGVDSLRLYYAHVASPFADVEWDEDTVTSYKVRLEKVVRIIADLCELSGETEGVVDKWMASRLSKHVNSCREHMQSYDLRQMANAVYFDIPNDIRWYLRRGGRSLKTASMIIDTWLHMMCPITPHLAEELWESIGGKGLLSSSAYPVGQKVDTVSELSESYLRDVLEDVNEILRVTGMSPSMLHIYTAPSWKKRIHSAAVRLAKDRNLTIPALTKEVMRDEEIRRHGKEASELAKKIAQDIMHRSPFELERLSVMLDEAELLREARGFLESELGFSVDIQDGDSLTYDPKGKAKVAMPLRPALYLE